MRTTKTAKASIIRIAPPIVEEPSESLEPLKELFEKKKPHTGFPSPKVWKRESTLPTGVSKSVLSVTSLLLIPLSNRLNIRCCFPAMRFLQHLFRRKFLLPGRVHRLQIDGNQFRRVYIQSCTDDKLQQPVHQPRHEQNEPDAI